MKFFADTADLSEIEYCFSQGVCDGITTNPKIIELSGDLSHGFKGACNLILNSYKTVPVSLETDLCGLKIEELDSRYSQVRDTLLNQAHTLASWGDNVIVKIPISKGGLEAVKELLNQGIKTNVTACMTPHQALEAADAGANYVSLFANRMVDSHILNLSGKDLEYIAESNWKEVVKKNVKHKNQAWDLTLEQISYVSQSLGNNGAKLIVGSIRDPRDIYQIAQAEPHIITIPTPIVRVLENITDLKELKRTIICNTPICGDSLSHPMTSYTLQEFENAADKYRK